MEFEQVGPSSPPQQREEIGPEIQEIHRNKVVLSPAEIDPNRIDELIADPRAFLVEIVRDK